MKIILVANTDWYLYNFRRSLAEYLRANGHEITLVSPDGPFVEGIRRSGFRWLKWPVMRNSVGPGELLAVSRLANLYRQERPELVHLLRLSQCYRAQSQPELQECLEWSMLSLGLGMFFSKTP